MPAWLTGTCRVCANGYHRERACYWRCAVTAAAGHACNARTKGLQPRLQRAPNVAMPQYKHALVLRPEVTHMAASECGAANAWHSNCMRYLPCARVMRARLVTGKEHLKVVQRTDCRLPGRNKLPRRCVPGSMLLARMECKQLPHLRQDDGHAPGPMPISVNLLPYLYITLSELQYICAMMTVIRLTPRP